MRKNNQTSRNKKALRGGMEKRGPPFVPPCGASRTTMDFKNLLKCIGDMEQADVLEIYLFLAALLAMRAGAHI